jgi:hydrogenase-4 component F
MHAVSGALRADRLWGLALVVSLLALIGIAPFSIFMSEYQLLRAAVGAEAWLLLGLFLAGSGVVFVSALRHMIEMAYGSPHGQPLRTMPNSRLAVPIVATAIALLLILGLWMPLPLSQAIGSAASVLAGRAG